MVCKLKCSNWADITSALGFGLNKIRRTKQNNSKVHSLKFYHYFIFSFETKIHIPKGKLTQLKFNQKMTLAVTKKPEMEMGNNLLPPLPTCSTRPKVETLPTGWTGFTVEMLKSVSVVKINSYQSLISHKINFDLFCLVLRKMACFKAGSVVLLTK